MILVAKLIKAGGYIPKLTCLKLSGRLGSTDVQYTVGRLGSTGIPWGKLVLFYLLLGFEREFTYFKCILNFGIRCFCGDITMFTM